ncbi:hypothetical protein [Roseixanthobacter liquoris]|uniref:hypothetical protein n=1 Tax=Roseixanthobacter liquoris TaxID=3119921 RepID=UPI00372852D5
MVKGLIKWLFVGPTYPAYNVVFAALVGAGLVWALEGGERVAAERGREAQKKVAACQAVPTCRALMEWSWRLAQREPGSTDEFLAKYGSASPEEFNAALAKLASSGAK